MSLRFRRNFPLAPLSTFRMGGRGQLLCAVSTPKELIAGVLAARWAKLPYHILAGGSNVVFPDDELEGILIRLCGGKSHFDGRRCLVDAGVELAEVIRQSLRRGLQGLETLSGIPGTVGGAIVGNAGAYGHSISEVVEKVEIFDGRGVRWLTRPQCRFAYRQSVFKQKPYLVLRALLKFRSGDRAALQKTSRDIIRLRRKKYKPGLRCPGSFFKNVLVKDVGRRSLARVDRSKIIEGKIPAGYLLEEVGAKGMRRGGIVIADFHGNLFINRGHGTARDVRRLADLLRARVQQKFGITLQEEIRYF